MIREAIDKILQLSPVDNSIIKIDDVQYTAKQINPVEKPEHHVPAYLKFNTLKGIADYVRDNIDSLHIGSLCFCVDPQDVLLYGPMQKDNCNRRFLYAVSKFQEKIFDFGQWFDLETFIINLQSRFVQTEVVENMLSALANMASKKVRQHTDSGFGQSIEVKVGLELRTYVDIKNPLELHPYLTFHEVEQPAMSCVLRLRETKDTIQCALFQADGGAWKTTAIENICDWLTEDLEAKIKIYG